MAEAEDTPPIPKARKRRMDDGSSIPQLVVPSSSGQSSRHERSKAMEQHGEQLAPGPQRPDSQPPQLARLQERGGAAGQERQRPGDSDRGEDEVSTTIEVSGLYAGSQANALERTDLQQIARMYEVGDSSPG